MRGFTKLPEGYFEKYSDKPVKLVPFNPKAKDTASIYINRLKAWLSGFDTEILHRGSTAFGITGKGEIEIGIYPKDRDWDKVIAVLRSYLGEVSSLEENHARLNDDFEGFEIEIILMKGYDAEVDKKLTGYLINSPETLKGYEALKRKYSYSKREYMIQKNKFLGKIVEKL